MNKLTKEFYTRPNVVEIAQDLLGKYLFTEINGQLCGGMIVETEAYCGENDRACHSWNNRRTARTEIMYQTGGVAYVYLIYGMHYLFNIVTNVQDKADAVLIRAMEPVYGTDLMQLRRNMPKLHPPLTAGPGVLSKALGIDNKLNGTDLVGDNIWVEDRNVIIDPENILASPRVGVGYAGEDAQLPWRFRIKNSKWVSKAK